MNSEIIKCPECGFEIEVTQALTKQIRDSLKLEIEPEIRKRERAISDKAKELE